jgi:hypothetical protein
MVRRASLRLFPSSSAAALLCLSLASALCLGGILALPARAGAATYAPVAAYSFDEGEGTAVVDASGNGNDGTVEGATWTNGRYGGALSFDGTGNCVTVPASPALELREELTVEAWIRPEGTGEAESIVFKEAEGEWFGYSLFLGLQASGKVEGLIANDPETESAPTVYSPVVEPNVWTHVALTYDGKHERLYIDGELVDVEAAEPPNPNDGDLRIGCTQEHETGFDGKIDEVRIYERALGQAEVAADMEAPLQTPKAGPVAEYSFDEGTGEAVADLSGNGNEGTVEGASWSRGRYGSALEFDGSSTCVSVPDSGSLQLSEEFTIEAWVRPEGSFVDEPLILKEVEPGAGPSYDLGIGISEAGRPEGYAEGDEVEAPHELERGVWAHLAYTYDGGRMRLFVDGEQVASKWVGADTMEGSGPLRIGCWPGHEYAEARIDEVRLYDRALDAGEVAADMEAPIQTPRQGPIAAWSFDEGEGSTVEDITGDEHEGTVEGATWTKGRYGSALSFDGSEDCVTVPASSALEGREELTVEAWIRPEGTGEAESIVFKEAEGEWFGYTLFLGLQASGKVEGLIGETPTYASDVESPHTIPTDVWTHVALTYDGRHERLYVDGELVDTELSEAPIPNTGPLRIGCTGEGETSFDGKIDEVRIYERALGQAEIATDMEAPVLAHIEERYEAENEDGETTIALGTINQGAPDQEVGVFVSLMTLGQPETMGEGPSAMVADARPPKRRRAYRFNECYWDRHGSEIPGGNHLDDLRTKVASLVEQEAEDGSSEQCHGETEEGTFAVRWAIAASGLFFYRQGDVVWVEEPPSCNQWGPEQPAEATHCETASNLSTEHLDILGDWRWAPTHFAETFTPLHAVCGQLNGVIPVNPPKQENGEPVIHESFHFHYWPDVIRGEEQQPCDWKHPQYVEGF